MIKSVRSLLENTLVRFALVGVINTVFGSAVMFGAYNLFGLSYELSVVANYFFGSILSFFLNKHFTFRSSSHWVGEVLRFALNICICAALAYGVARPATHLLLSALSETQRDNISMLVGMILFASLNYLGQRFFAFRKQ